MSSKNVLVVALEPAPDEEIRSAVESRGEPGDLSVLVVAPATGVSRLQWLTGAEDGAREEAAEIAERTAEAVEAEVQTEVGDHDPVLAVEDALSEFPADEIVLAGHADAKTEAELRRFGIPVTRLEGAAGARDEDLGSAEEVARDATRGRSEQAPAVVLTTVGVVVLSVAALFSLLVFLVLWLM
jgi:hypothetical protein